MRERMRDFGRHLLTACGLVALAVGLLGVFLPLVPTTPFVLLAAACFLRGSERLHRWLLADPRFGPHIRGLRSGAGVGRRVKLVALSTLWVSVIASGGLVLAGAVARPVSSAIVAVLLACALSVSWYLLVAVPTCFDVTGEAPDRDASEAAEAQVQ